MIEQSQYHCPKCNKSLTDDKKVILHFKKSSSDNFSEIYLAPEPGNYKFYTIPETGFKNGDRVVFYCPKCKVNLTSKRDSKFAELKMKVNDFIFFEALFSTVYGDKRTYIITEDDIDVYGDANFEDMPFPDLSIGEVPY
tara:strand:- start:114879 stop:115295 length:417 start_codon:yes stop_codon:yes gene_type:complete